SGNDVDADNADIKPIYDKEPMVEAQLTVEYLSKPVTQHYLPKEKEYDFAKSNHMIASSSSRNSSKNIPRFSSNDMVHNHYLEDAKKKTQEKDRNSKSSVMHTASLQNTTNGRKPKSRIINQTIRSFPVSKSNCVTLNVVPLVDNSRSPSPFLDSKHFVCSTCHKGVFNANHDACITKFLKEVNSRAKIQSHKTKNNSNKSESHSTLARARYDSHDVNDRVGKSIRSLFGEYFIKENQVVSKSSAVTNAGASAKRQQQPDSTSYTSTLATSVTTNGNFDL
ncbi:hypothetical protein Tco_1431712, partial [Tanacetum coccineum]